MSCPFCGPRSNYKHPVLYMCRTLFGYSSSWSSIDDVPLDHAGLANEHIGRRHLYIPAESKRQQTHKGLLLIPLSWRLAPCEIGFFHLRASSAEVEQPTLQQISTGLLSASEKTVALPLGCCGSEVGADIGRSCCGHAYRTLKQPTNLQYLFKPFF